MTTLPEPGTPGSYKCARGAIPWDGDPLTDHTEKAQWDRMEKRLALTELAQAWAEALREYHMWGGVERWNAALAAEEAWRGAMKEQGDE